MQSTPKINPPFFPTSSLSFLCESHFVDLWISVLCISVSDCDDQVLHECMFPAAVNTATYELTLHLHSHLQIKAKNYDKVEKVSGPSHTQAVTLMPGKAPGFPVQRAHHITCNIINVL